MDWLASTFRLLANNAGKSCRELLYFLFYNILLFLPSSSVVLTRATSSSTTYHCASCSKQMPLSEMKQLYARIDAQLTNVQHVIGLNGNSQMPAAQLATFAGELAQLMATPGMKIYWEMLEIYMWAKSQYCSMARMLGEVLRVMETANQLLEKVSGLSRNTSVATVALAHFYAKMGNKKRVSEYNKKAIDLLQALALIDIGDIRNCPLPRVMGGGLLNEDFAHLWNEARKLKLILANTQKQS